MKSLDGQPVEAADVLASGALAHDRAYALVDAAGTLVNAKRHAALHRPRSQVDFERGRIDLCYGSGREPGAAAFDLSDRAPLEAWLSAALGFAVTLVEDRATGFPDDPESPGPTIVSTATLAEIGGWFGLALDDVRARLRANVEIGGVPAFWEDRLISADGAPVAFSIGGCRLLGINPCQRCAVPTRDPWTGEIDKAFTKRFIERRRATLPAWAAPGRFDHYYMATVNTRLAGDAGPIRLGDEVSVGKWAPIPP